MPPQVGVGFEKIGKLLMNLKEILTFEVIPGNIFLKTIMSFFMNFLWVSLHDLSFLTLLSLISLTVPGLAHSLQEVIL
jgi:hypothetical protein